MAITYEVVRSEDVFRFVERAEPEMTLADLAAFVGRNEAALRRWKKNGIMRLETADFFLTKFELSYLLSTGDIEILTRQKKPTAGSFKKGHTIRKKRVATNV